ncbi:MAG: FKBP-type peptidyl-prolyl cis-trans isomerase [Myxococcota bacterium]
MIIKHYTYCLLACSVLFVGCQKSADESAAKDAAAADAQENAAHNDTQNDAKAPPMPASIPAPEDVAAAPQNAEKTASGIAFTVLKAGTGTEKPTEWDSVEVHYTGWTTDGKMFDSSVQRGRPATFPLNRVIKGWTEGVQLMTVGEKRRFWIPGDLAYGETPTRPGAPAGTLVFDIELLGITPGPKPIPAPADVAEAPKSATKTKSGLAYKVISKGKGKRKPKETDRVEVHYTGWTTNGQMFDSSVQRGQPATFPLNGVIKGWTEGLQLMTEGEKARFWIPAALAYGETPSRPGAPAGMLVFDVELIKVL